MSKFTGEVTLVYTLEYDDDELELDGRTLADLTRGELRAARKELVEATYSQGDCTYVDIDILEATDD